MFKLALRMKATHAARFFREAGAAAWIGGQLFAVVALPRAAAAIPRWRDRRRILTAGWRAWTPLALGAMTLATAGSFLEWKAAVGPIETRKAKLRFGSALLGLSSTAASTVLGELAKRDPLANVTGMSRDASGYPVAISRGSKYEKGMAPLNVLHALGAAGLILADA